jgi:hypothetical protein
MRFSTAHSKPQDQFPNETPAQRAKHREIAHRYRRRNKPETLIINLRKAELEMVFNKQYGNWHLPDDDAGRLDLRIMLDHLAQLGEDHMRRWVNLRAPWMPPDELDDLIRDVGPGRLWTATALGKALKLTNADRIRLNIRTIRPVDRTAAQLKQDRKERHAAAEAARRLKAGATPRELSVEQQKPWIKEGVSRCTWYRRRKQFGTHDTNSCAIHLQCECCTKLSHGAPPPQGGSWARAVTTLPAGDAAIATEAVSIDRIFPTAAREPISIAISSSM